MPSPLHPAAIFSAISLKGAAALPCKQQIFVGSFGCCGIRSNAELQVCSCQLSAHLQPHAGYKLGIICHKDNMVINTFTVVNTIVAGNMLITGWSLASLKTLISESLTTQSQSQPGESQTPHKDGQAPDQASAVLPSAATTLAHLLEAYFSMHDTSVTQHRSQQSHQHSPAQSAEKLQTLLSLTALVGSLSCPVSSEHGRHHPNLHSGKAADEQSEQGPRQASPAASEHASEAQAQVQTPGVAESMPGQPGQEGELQDSMGSQQSL